MQLRWAGTDYQLARNLNCSAICLCLARRLEIVRLSLRNVRLTSDGTPGNGSLEPAGCKDRYVHEASHEL